MKILRLKVTQKQAHYGRPECVDNRMTYPLPPYSTVIGALHAACGYKEYHPMNISIQGKYGSISNNIKRYEIFLNHVEDERGILVYRPNANISKFIKVAKAIIDKTRKEKASFFKKTAIDVYDERLLNKYINTKEKMKEYGVRASTNLEDVLTQLKEKKDFDEFNTKRVSAKFLENLVKNNCLVFRAEENKYYIKDKEKIKNVIENILEYNHFSTLQPSIVRIETLNDVELVIHIQADEQTLNDIMRNQKNLVSLGRSEDYINLEEIKMVDATDDIDKEYKIKNQYQMFVNRKVFEHREKASGTVYFLPKNYQLEPAREFKNIPVLLTSAFSAKEKTENILVDGEYIINLN